MNNADMWISYKSKRSEFPNKWKDWDFKKHKVRLFEEQIQGWILNIVEGIIDKDRAIPHSDFAILAIILSYFENIAKFYIGSTKVKKGDSNYYFRKGLRLVYPKFKKVKKKTIEYIYDQTRCGMYHICLTKRNVLIECSINLGIVYKRGNITICPRIMAKDIKDHFGNYFTNLKNPKLKRLRRNFDKRYKFILGF